MRLASIKKNREFRRIYAEGLSTADKFLVLYRSPKREEAARIGISISRKVGGAVVRNRIKRRIKEILRKNIGRLGNYDIIFVVRVAANKADFEDLEKSVNHFLVKTLATGK